MKEERLAMTAGTSDEERGLSRLRVATICRMLADGRPSVEESADVRGVGESNRREGWCVSFEPADKIRLAATVNLARVD